jgi:Cu/Ag efflux protein CusF
MRSQKLIVVMAVVFAALGAFANSGRHRGAASVPGVHAQGAITAVSATSITAGGTTFTINASTKIRKGETAATAADLKVGDQVEIKGVVQNGANVATEIEVESAPDDKEPEATANGVVKSVGTSSLVVHRANGDDVTVQVTSTTTIKKGGSAIKLADIKVGDLVEARGTRVDDHTITAVAINVEDHSVDQKGGEANGVVASVGASSLVVHTEHGTDTTVQVNASTKITKQGKTITLADIKVGDRVEAVGTRVDDHTITAVAINVEDHPTDQEGAEAKGVVASVGASSLVVHAEHGADTTVQANASTKITKYDKTIAFTDIKVGDRVYAEGTRVDDHTILAAKIYVEAPH